MKKTITLGTALVFLAALPSLADQQQVFQEMQKGKEALERSCTTCHDRGQAADGDRNRAGWTAVIDEMIGNGAEVDAGEKEALAGFLAAGSLLRKKCSVCHKPERPLSKNKDLAAWGKTVKRMGDKRPGHLTAQDIEQIVGYLAAERPPN